jgi:hypothetical protein
MRFGVRGAQLNRAAIGLGRIAEPVQLLERDARVVPQFRNIGRELKRDVELCERFLGPPGLAQGGGEVDAVVDRTRRELYGSR